MLLRSLALLAAFGAATVPALAQLAPGDLAVVGYRADNPDEFAVVALAAIPAGTEIAFTDNGWLAGGGFRSTEDTYRYTVPAGGLAPGTVISFSDVGLLFSASGDQVLVYAGADGAPAFVYALNNEGAATWQADATSSNTSALPTGLVSGETAVALAEVDNAAYTGPTAGTRAELLGAISDAANWTGDNTAKPAFPTAFTVTDGGDGGNAVPAFTAELTTRSVPAGQPFSFDYDAVDGDGDPLSFALFDGPGGAGVDASTGLFSWTPGGEQTGQSFDVVVTVTDGAAADTARAVLTVAAPANRPPAFTALVYGAVAAAGGSVSVDYAVTDPDGDAVTIVPLSGAGPVLVSGAPGAGSATVTVTAPSAPGVYAFSIGATDGADTTAVPLYVAAQGRLFAGLDPAATRAALRAAYGPDQTLGYDRARDTLYTRVEGFPDGVVEGVYTGFSVALDPGQDPSAFLFARGIDAEHTWPQSKGAGSEPQRSDMHILYPSKSNVNSARGNDPYAEIPDAETARWYRLDQSQTTIPTVEIDTWSENGPGAFEPREAVKGDVARAALYFAAVYESAADEAFLGAQLETLLEWDAQDAAGAEEALRSGLISGYQGNVNPFVLDPTLALRAFVGEGAGAVAGSLAYGTCPEPPAALPPGRASCRVEATGTLAGDRGQRFTVFLRVAETGRIAFRGEVKPQAGQTVEQSVKFTTTAADPSSFTLELVAEEGSVGAPSGAAEVIGTATFVKGGAGLLAREPLSAYPNPAAGEATLRFAVEAAEEARLVVYDGLGREVARPVEGRVEGAVEARLGAGALPAGVYVVRLTTASGRSEVVRLTLVR